MDDFEVARAQEKEAHGSGEGGLEQQPRGRGAGRRAASAGGSRAAAKSAGGKRASSAPGGSAKTKNAKCLVPYCVEMCANQKVWCAGHACSWTGFCSQCEEQGPSAVVKMESLKAPGMEKEKGEAVGAYALKNPPDKKYQKKQLFDVCGYFKQKYATTATAERDDERPMTREAFGKHCENLLGLTEPEAASWWQELEDNPATERDQKGFRGRLQLWIPLGESRQRKREKGVTDGVVQESKKMKNSSDHDLQVLSDHVLRQRTSMADSFLTSETGEEARAMLKRTREKAEQQEGSEPKPVQHQRKRAKTFDGDRDAPKYHNSMETDLEKLRKKMEGVEQPLTKAKDELKAIPEDVKHGDLALQGYIRKLQWRYQVYLKWQGLDEVVKLYNTHVPEGSSASSAGQESAFPVSAQAEVEMQGEALPAPL